MTVVVNPSLDRSGSFFVGLTSFRLNNSYEFITVTQQWPDILVATGVIKISLHSIYEEPTPVKAPLNYRYDASTASWTCLKHGTEKEVEKKGGDEGENLKRGFYVM
ncbi:hypothetical protein QTP86_002527 [Hemibagrus guttatus]|nr:hypothetical protein QTP86_002527 [Hemibagrus guttatus]